MDKPLQVAFYPGDGWHAYQESMARALRPYDIHAYQGGSFSNQSLLADQRSDILHFHWIERLWDGEGLFNQIKLVFGVYRYLKLARRLGKKIVWTVHNHYPHENARLPHIVGLKLFARYADAIYVHSQWSQQWVIRHLKPTVNPLVVHHGNFADIFNYEVDTEQYKTHCTKGRGALVGILGTIRKNRGYEQSIDAIVAGKRQDLTLVIAGKSTDPDYLASLQQRAAQSDHIIFDTRHFSDAEYQQVSSACDILLLNYSDITTSGALLSAWTNKTSVITSDLPYFREIVGELSPAGAVNSSDQPEQLLNLIERILSYPESQRRTACQLKSELYGWPTTILPLVASYRELMHVTAHNISTGG